MKGGARGVTVVIQRDGTTRSRTLRLPLWVLRLGTLGGYLQEHHGEQRPDP